jgi:hypothetical protein
MRRARKSFAAHGSIASPAALPLALGQPERLVGVGFRLWLSGLKTGDIRFWEQAWCTYSSCMGPDVARAAVSELASWVRLIKCHSQRELQTATAGCDGFCRDECVAISMIAACQHNACPAMRACAFTLLGCSVIDEVVEVAENFAHTLQDADHVLSPALTNNPALLTLPAATAARH